MRIPRLSPPKVAIVRLTIVVQARSIKRICQIVILKVGECQIIIDCQRIKFRSRGITIVARFQ